MAIAIENTTPGVVALVNQGQVARPVQRQPTSTAFAVGYAPWGPVNTPKVITSFAEFAREFGGFDANSYLDDFLYAFFNLFPGRQAVVCRVVGAAAAVATVTLKDKSADAGLDTVRVDAKYPSSRVDVRVTIEAGSAANTFKLTERSVFLNHKRIFDNLTLASIAEVNQKARLIKITNLNSATAAPNNIPRVLAEATLAGGSDDFVGMNAASYIGTDGGAGARTGLQTFNDEKYGTGQVAVPGITTDPTHAALVAHATAFNRLALLDPAFGASKTDVATARANYGTRFGAIYYPWVECLDFEGTGLKRFYPPSAFAAGACAEVDRNIGTHKAPANIAIPAALDVERAANGQPQIDDATREFLNGKDINVIAPLPSQGTKIYGGRVMAGASDRRVQFVHESRVLNLLYHSAKQAYAWTPFAVVDGTGKLFRDLRSTGTAFLRALWQDGALFGKKPEEAFVVIADASNNPPSELENGRVHVQWGVRLSPTAEQILINIDNVPLSSDLSVLQ